MERDLAGLEVFRTRALAEAARYGDEPWVFVRELIQNARDADASSLRFTVGQRPDGGVRLRAVDDGRGMSLDHARRYLFTLYATSKRARRRTAGRFGVGFWSVLRFEPDVVTVRSRSARGSGWEVRLQGDEAHVTSLGDDLPVGTEIVLERPSGGVDVAAEIRRAVAELAGLARRRDRPELPLEVVVDGRPVAAAEGVPAPLLRFEARGLRGVVGLATEPRVELYVHGFRVRNAAVLDDLRPPADARRPAAEVLPAGVAPWIVLDSERLDLLMSRAEPRASRELERVLRIGRRQTARLVRHVLGGPAPGRRWEWLHQLRYGLAEWGRRRWPAALVLLAAIVAIGILMAGVGRRPASPAGAPGATAAGAGDADPLTDLALRYRGPSVDRVEAVSPAPDLRYRPASLGLLVAGLRVRQVDDVGRAVIPVPSGEPVPAAPCATGCLEMLARSGDTSGWLRLPTPTGWVVDPASVRLDGAPVALQLSTAGEPLVAAGDGGRLTWRLGRGPDPAPAGVGSWPELPEAWRRRAAGWRGRPAAEIAAAATALVRSQVRYDRGPETAQRFAAGAAAGLPLVPRALAVGAGDCDVQSTLLAALVEAAGRPARLAVGWAGAGGRLAPGLHAWVEVRDADGSWLAADASVAGAAPGDAPVPGMAVVPVAVPVATPGIGVAPVAVAVGLVLLGVAVLAGAMLRRMRAVRTAFIAGDGPDLDGLVLGLVSRPEQWRDGAASLPVLETVGGGRLSAAAARRLAAQGRLCVATAPRSELAPAARTLDGSRRRCRSVAEALGAVDLDRWVRMLERTRRAPALDLAAAALAAAGLHLALRLTDEAEADPVELLRPTRGRPVALLAAHGDAWQEVVGSAAGSPALGAAAVVRVVLPLLVGGSEARAVGRAAARWLLATGVAA